MCRRPLHGLKPFGGPLILVLMCAAASTVAAGSQAMRANPFQPLDASCGPAPTWETASSPCTRHTSSLLHSLVSWMQQACCRPPSQPPPLPDAAKPWHVQSHPEASAMHSSRRLLWRRPDSVRSRQQQSAAHTSSLSVSMAACLTLKWCLLAAQQLRGWLRYPRTTTAASTQLHVAQHSSPRHLLQAAPSSSGGMSAGGVIMIVGIVVPLAVGIGVVIGLLCWHRKRRLRYIFLSNARRHKEADHKPRAHFSSDTMRSANGSVNARPESHELPNAFRNAASVPWSSAGSRRGATTPGHHELEMNIMGHHPGMMKGHGAGLHKHPSAGLWPFGSQEIMFHETSLGSSNDTSHDLKHRTQSSRSLMPKPVGGFVITRSDLTFSRCIGEGSFGRVYLGMWRETTVAIKILFGAGVPKSLPMPLSADEVARASVLSNLQREYTPEDQMHASILERDAHSREVQAASSMQQLLTELQREAGLMATLRHPNVVMFLGVCTEPPCVVTEFCARGSMLDALQRAHKSEAMAMELDWQKRLSMALDAAKGMHYLHSSQPPIVHRDLKSANLLVDKHWRVKVADFNLSRFMNSSDVVSSVAATNPRWLAPEVLSGDEYGTAADVYSFGIIMWELLMWQIPWDDAGPWQVVLSVVDQSKRPEIPPLAEAMPGGCPRAWDGYRALMERCWHQKPAKRPGFEAVIASLRALIVVEEQSIIGGEALGPERASASGSSRERNPDTAFLTWTASQKSTTQGPQASQDLQNFPPVDASQDLLGSEEAPLPLDAGPPLLLELAGSQPLPLNLSCRPLAERVSVDPRSQPLALLPLEQDQEHTPAQQQEQPPAEPLLVQLPPRASLAAPPSRRRNRLNPFADAANLKKQHA